MPGGAQVARACLAAGLADQPRLHLVPVLLGGGTPLFGPAGPGRVELEQTEAVPTALATHLTFRVARPPG